MKNWLNEHAGKLELSLQSNPHTDRALRAMDVALVTAVLSVIILPLVLLRSRIESREATGLNGVPFTQLMWTPGSSRIDRCLAALGATWWPTTLNILRGDMAWVGPRARATDEPVPAATTRVRPGLINSWFLRRRTAVDFQGEDLCDAQYLAMRGIRHDLGVLARGAIIALLPRAPTSTPDRVLLGSVLFDNVTMHEALAKIGTMLGGTATHQVSFVNPACVNIAANEGDYRRALARCALVLPDGIGIKIGSMIVGSSLKQNVNGTDLFPRLCDVLEERGASIFLLGGKPGVADDVAREIKARWPKLRIAGSRDGYFKLAEEGDVVAEVRASGADVLLVARGVPTQDLFIDRYLPLFGVKIAMGVGGLFDFVSGRISRAPLWMRETGVEWIWRLMQEPGRMWQRYLIGNLTFLARVIAQRMKLQRSIANVPTPTPARTEAADYRAVVFATTTTSVDIPVASQTPVAVLPLGHQTIIEHAMERLSQTPIRDVDVVVSDEPETIRALIGDGARWGLRIRLHLAKDPRRPYAILKSLSRATNKHLVIGHVNRLPSLSLLEHITANQEVVLAGTDEQGPRWSGWASSAPASVPQGIDDADHNALAVKLTRVGIPISLCDAGEMLAFESAPLFLEAQFDRNGNLRLSNVPASWIRTEWGAMSPQARVMPGAVIEGPAIIGPGCLIEDGATIGAQTLLTQDIVVSANTRIERSIVLPNTFIGSDLELKHAIVNGTRVRHVALGVELNLVETDAILLSLNGPSRKVVGWVSRFTAALALVAVGPLLLAHLAMRRLSGRAAAWSLQEAVTGRDASTGEPTTSLMRVAQPRSDRGARRWAKLAGLLDIVAGRRAWFGMRPRTVGEWYALPARWQDGLATTVVGLLHAPAWTDDEAVRDEARAAADVFGTTRSTLAGLWDVSRATLAAMR